jgi:predicted alpha/beta superfamily hydrolase
MLKFLKGLVLTFLAFLWMSPAGAVDEVTLRFIVTVPPGTKVQSLRVVGDHPKLGSWKVEKALKLLPLPKKTTVFAAELVVKKGTQLKFKIVRDSWASVEKSIGGGEIGNRKWNVIEPADIELRVARWADKAAPSTAEAHIALLGQFGKKSLGVDRPVWVHRPSTYKKKRSYPVLYMLDGQNIFDKATAAFGEEWAADETHDRLLKEGKIEPFIIVAIGNSPLRMYEYTPDRDPKHQAGGGLHKLEMMIRQEIEPVLRKKYSVKSGAKHRGILGSSLGGLAAFHLSLRHPDRYGLVGVFSPSLWWNSQKTLKLVKGMKKITRARRLWIDMGTGEGDGASPVRQVRDLASLLKGKGYKKTELKVFIDEGAKHTEPAWRNRLPKAFIYLFGRKSGQPGKAAPR